MLQETLTIKTQGRSILDITQPIARLIQHEAISTGICHVFLQHTSASLILCENADPTVREDLENFMAHLVKDGASNYQHDAEGPDDMPAHIRSILTSNSLSIPIVDSSLGLGTWQGVYLWEHRYRQHQRHVIVTAYGEYE